MLSKQRKSTKKLAIILTAIFVLSFIAIMPASGAENYGQITVTKEVYPSDAPWPEYFRIEVTGPDYSEYKEFTEETKTQTWDGLWSGEYTISEVSEYAGPNWISDPSLPITVQVYGDNHSFTITNTYKEGEEEEEDEYSITVTKKVYVELPEGVDPEDCDMSDLDDILYRTFEVTCLSYDPDYQSSKDISWGKSVVFDIAEPGTYYIWEDVGPGWIHDSIPWWVDITPNDPHQEVTLINTFRPNVIEVTKAVYGYEGNKSFDITVQGVTEGEENDEEERYLEDNTSYKVPKSLKAGQSKLWLVPFGEFKITEVHPGNNWKVDLPENINFDIMIPQAVRAEYTNGYYYESYKEATVINTYDDDNGGGNNNRRRHRDNDDDEDEEEIIPQEPTPEAPVEIPQEPDVMIIPEEPIAEAPAAPEALPKTGGFPLAATVLGTALAGLGIMLRKRS